MGKKPRSFRTTITVPQDLKARMNAAEKHQDINWSAIACRAFEAQLAEVASRKARKTMDDVIQRLRVSLEEGESESYKSGEADGRAWAESTADAKELLFLERFQATCGGRWADVLRSAGEGRGRHSLPDLLFLEMHPGEDESGSAEFWGSVLEGREGLLDDPVYLTGFADGALSLWDEVKNKL
jgi:hypothetical protein